MQTESPVRRLPRVRSEWDWVYPRADKRVDGRSVGDHVPNRESIAASLNDYDTLKGIREVKVADIGAPPERTPRILALAEAIRESGEVTPLIVVHDAEGPYVLEGSHRYSALALLGAASFPALVVIEYVE